MKNQNKTLKRGFTLVELVLVLAILAILSAITIPAVGYFVQSSNYSADTSNAKIIEHAIKTAVSEIKNGTADKELLNASSVADVGLALKKAKLSEEILNPKSQGNCFWFNTKTQKVIISKGDLSAVNNSNAPTQECIKLLAQTSLGNTNLFGLNLNLI